MKRRISILLVVMLIISMMPLSIFAKDYPPCINPNPNIIDIPYKGYEVTSSQGLYVKIELAWPSTSPSQLIISSFDAEWTTDENGIYLGGPVLDKDWSPVNEIYYSLDMSRNQKYLYLNYSGGEYTEFYVPMLFKAIQSKDVSVSFKWIYDETGFAYFVDGAKIGRYTGIIDNNRSSSSSSSITTIPIPIQKEEVKESVKPKAYLTAEDITISKIPVSFKDIADGTEEASIISNLSSKGIIVQTGEVFDLKKELATDETLTYLSKLLVINNAADSKLDKEVVEKYLDPNNENFAYLATVGSMLTEDTLKTISETTEMSRELFAQVLREVTNIETEDKEVPFTDLDGSTYKEALEYCYNGGILIGTSESTMSPKDIITNKQMLQVLSRLDKKLNVKEEA